MSLSQQCKETAFRVKEMKQGKIMLQGFTKRQLNKNFSSEMHVFGVELNIKYKT